MPQPLISVETLNKTFKIPQREKGFWGETKALFRPQYVHKTALQSVSFDIAQGELVGYIGPNGAGKSTTVKILSGILVPDAGTVKVLGKTPWQHRIEVVRNIGVVFGQRTQLWWDLEVIESLGLLKSIYGLGEAQYRNTLESLVTTLNLSRLLHVPVRLLSLGERMRCELAASLLHTPKILFLDEPTIGLDAVNKLAVRDIIRRLSHEHKVTILLTTHDMDDIEVLCHRVLVLNQGALYFDGLLTDLRKQVLPERRLVVDMADPSDSLSIDKAQMIRQEGRRVWFRFNPHHVRATDLISQVAERYQIADLFVENPPVEEMIATLYRNG